MQKPVFDFSTVMNRGLLCITVNFTVYYNCTRVLCECHGYRRDRESSRVPVKMLKRFSQKIIKLQSYV